MTAPAIQVLLGFDATATLGNNFVLDDPAKGVLNNTTYTLAGTVFVDVTQYCSGQITTNRGRSRETEQYQAGIATFTLRNEDRRFDPSNTAGPYYPGVVPRILCNIFLAGVQIFGGYVDDLDVQYEKPNICTVAVTCVDSFGLLANQTLRLFTASSQLSGARVSAVLNRTEVNFPATRNIATGQALLQSGTFDNVAALDHLQTVMRSENGYLFVDRSGVLNFIDRYGNGPGGGSIFSGAGTQIHTFHAIVELNPAASVFSDSGVGVPYTTITQKSQALLLYNSVTGTRNGSSSPQTAGDSASQSTYAIRALALSQLENNQDSDVLNICQYLVGRYSQPDVRFDQLSIELQTAGLNVASLAMVELAQIVTVTRTPFGTGTPSVITKTEMIDGIAFAFDVSQSSYLMTLRLGSFDSRKFFVLDDTNFGVLDSSKLNY